MLNVKCEESFTYDKNDTIFSLKSRKGNERKRRKGEIHKQICAALQPYAYGGETSHLLQLRVLCTLHGKKL